MISLLAIDPGKSGGMCLMITDVRGSVLDTTLRAFSPSGDVSSDIHAIFHAAMVAVQEPDFVRVEDVHGSGRHSDFSFGVQLGHIQQALMTFGWDWQTISPQVWQRPLTKGLTFESAPARKRWLNKQAKRLALGTLTPGSQSVTLKTCDALLIARHAASGIGGPL